MQMKYLQYILILTILIHASIAENVMSEEKRKEDVGKVAVNIMDAIRNQDEIKLLKYISKDGIPCIDSLISLSQVKADLSNIDSWLHGYLFSLDFKKESDNYIMGLGEFFNLAGNIEIDVTFMETNESVNYDYACVHYRAVGTEYSPEICLFKMNNNWTVTDSLYSCL